MSYLITGSVATDQLMTFPGKFSDSLLKDRLDKVSVSFLIDDMTVQYGGVAANISYGLGVLRQDPVLVASVGLDFSAYGQWLVDHGVNITALHHSKNLMTSRFVCTTDQVMAQIASFYPGAMTESSSINLEPLIHQHQPEAVIISACDPDAMLAHTKQAHNANIPVYADPSQQLARLDKNQILTLIDNANLIFSNDYEWDLILNKTGLSAAEVTTKVGGRITTLGEHGVELHLATADGEEFHRIPAVPEKIKRDPTGVGDAFRAGYLAGLSHKLSPVRSAQLGQYIAVLVLEHDGPQGWELNREEAQVRISAAYGKDAAEEILPIIP